VKIVIYLSPMQSIKRIFTDLKHHLLKFKLKMVDEDNKALEKNAYCRQSLQSIEKCIPLWDEISHQCKCGPEFSYAGRPEAKSIQSGVHNLPTIELIICNQRFS
jgi:hypothetical protein